MTTVTAHLPESTRIAGHALTRLTVRQVRRGALIVAVVCAGMSAIVAMQYQTTFAGEIDQLGLQVLAENPAIRILFGTPVALDDAGGFTVWRTGTPLLILASIWMLLAATRITRGEEDAGRVDLLLAGRVAMPGLILRSMGTLAGAALAISAATALALIGAGTDATGAVVYAVAILGVILTFSTGAVLAAQIMPTRAATVELSVGLLGVMLAVRMLADGTPQLGWLAWTSPFGLTALAAPFAENRVGPLFLLIAFPVAFGIAALLTSQRRDVGLGVVRLSTRRMPRFALLGSITGFAARRAVRPTAGWAIGIAAYFALFGALIATVLKFFDTNRRFAELAAAAGFAGLDSTNGFAATLFGLLAIPTGLYAATRLSALVADEQARRWTQLLATDVSRTRLLGDEIAVTTVGVALLHATAGLAMWSGASLTGLPLAITDALAGAMNSASIAWLALGAATLAVGWLPSAVSAVGAMPVVGGFLIKVIAESVGAPSWAVNLSPFAHLAAVPSANPRWIGLITFILIGAGSIGAGIAGYLRRDLTT